MNPKVRSPVGKMRREARVAEYVMNWRGELEQRLKHLLRHQEPWWVFEKPQPAATAAKKKPKRLASRTKKLHFPMVGKLSALGEHKAHLAVTIITMALLVPAPGAAVDCFKCSSRNGSNPACEDPFHNLNTTRVNTPILPDPPPNVIYHTPCYAGRKGREGLFPASACIKLTGTFDTTGETLVVRHCALDSGTLTQDTELARMSHCGRFQFEGDLLKGCVMACPNDACNGARNRAWAPHWMLISHLAGAAAFLYLCAAATI